MDQFGIPEKRYLTHDGIPLSYWVSRPNPAKDSGVTLCLANGIGISRLVWQDVVTAFRERYTLLFWDYRSFYRSATPPDPSHLRLEHHARDVAGLLALEKLERVVMIGWSMGVQVSLESWRFAGARQVGFVLMNGTSGRTFDTAFGLPGLIYWIPPLTEYLSRRHPHHLNRVLPNVFRKELSGVMQTAGVVARNVDRVLLERILEEYAQLDFGVYFYILNSLGRHAPAHLGRIQVPALVLVGGEDTFTPPLAGKVLRSSLPLAELERIEHGTHYMILEFQQEIRKLIEVFLENRVKPFLESGSVQWSPAEAEGPTIELEKQDVDSESESDAEGDQNRHPRTRERLRSRLHALQQSGISRSLREALREGWRGPKAQTKKTEL